MAATMRTIDYRRDRHTALNPRHSPQSWLRLPPPYSDSSLEQSIASNPHPSVSLTLHSTTKGTNFPTIFDSLEKMVVQSDENS